MEESTSEIAAGQLLSENQRQAIVDLANVRRETRTLEETLQGLPNKDTQDFKDQSARIKQVINGSELEDTEGKPWDELIASSIEKANEFADKAPNLAALHLAKAALFQREAALLYKNELQMAKKHLALSREKGFSPHMPADLLPDAYIIRVEKNAAEEVTLPSPQIIEQSLQGDPALLEDYKLVLAQEQPDKTE